MYDVCDRGSFESLNGWLQRLLECGSDGIIVLLVGNKIDKSAERVVSSDEGRKFAFENQLAFLEVSALAGTNIELAFKTILQRIYEELGGDNDDEDEHFSLRAS